MYRPGNGSAAQKPKDRPPPAGGNALVTFDAQLAKQQEEAQLAKERPKKNDYLDVYTGPKVKWEDTGLYKALVKSQDIEEELTKIRNLIRKRTDPGYEPNDEEDFKVAPIRKFDAKNDYYKLLEVDDFASVKDIKGAYKRLALQYHPDKNRDKKPDKLREMQDEFEKIQEAYEILSDRATRRQYDRSRFDEARAKSQGMNSSFYSQKTNSDANFWGRWSGKKEGRESGVNAQDVQNLLKSKAPKLPKAADLRFEIKISLEKALRGGLKIREVKRDRMQRAFGGTNQNLKTVNVKIDPGQADGSEYRLEGDGHWPSFNTTPGDLVVIFRHKPHAFLRQSNKETGALQLAMPLTVRAKATDPVLSAWSPTFKGSMVLIRFQNPLLKLAPNKACNVTFVIDGEGLPVPGEPTRRGPLAVTVHVQLDGNPLVPTMNAPCCRDVVAKRHLKNYNHQAHLRIALSNPRAAGFPVRKFVAGDAKERGGVRVGLSSVAVIWESAPGTDPVAFGKAAAALGHQAQLNPQNYGWCCNVGLLRQALPQASHVALADEELASESEEEKDVKEVLKQRKGHELTKRRRVRRQRPEVESFLLRFQLGPPEGFPDPGSTDEEAEPQSPVVPATAFSGQPGQATVELRVEGEKEGDEEAELTRLIREKQSELEAAKRRWAEKKEHQQGERQEEEGLLRELLEKDKKRELERVEREMNGLRSTFEFQLQAEKKWVDEFISTNNYQNHWVCVFKPAMVIRNKPAEDGPITRRIVTDEVIKAKGKVTDDYWIQLETNEWALTWHKVHGQLLQRWFGPEQQRYMDLQAKIEERRKGRNETFVAYRRKKKEIEQWSIPPGPSEEEKCELEDEEGEQLHFLMEPILKDLKDYKRRLRELRQKRFEAAAERQRRDAGADGLAAAPLPAGFEEALGSEEVPEAKAEANAEATTSEQRPWEETKQAADKAFKDKEWNTALSLYGQALELGGDALESAQRATLMSNRALVYAKLFDWAKSLEDAVDATIQEPEWPKAWQAARLAGNNDPNENQISHVFGQGSICVAMDFPGWMEIATIMFFITGLLHSYAMIKVYQHCKSEWEGKNSKRCLAAFVAFQILLVNCFWLVGIFNPVVDHSVDTVFAHSIPYVGLQVCFFFWVIFLLAFVHPTGVGRYLFSAAYVASQIFTLVLIFWTFAELAQPDVETAGPNRFKGPLPREGRILPLSEPVSLIFRLGCFFLHPLRIAAQSEKGEAAKAVTAKTEEV
ncbi:DnaJ-1 [Symbiodinium pilosum]|uniref:DnaJ-1 protein n=1 Tax=Symbiodinium pilosum TaxID=2952 RepID=A0A812RJN1_SYMPI|nr:DnaJ-1 [Symbiodinium pilosum]